MATKGFKTIDEQITLLRSRGLIIEDVEGAREFLLNNNYYRISGYSLTLRKNDTFFRNVTFQNIIDIYNFDHELRHVLLKYIEIFEVRIKSIYAYYFTKKYGPTGYLDSACFTNRQTHAKIIAKAEEQKVSRMKHEAYLKHYINDLKEDIPLWAYIDLFTIANISFLYSISDINIKKTIAAEFSMKTAKGGAILEHFIHRMTIIRNLCAHGGRLYNRLFEQKPWLSKKEKSLLIRKDDGSLDNAHLYSFVIILKRLLSDNDFSSMKNDIIALSNKYSFVHMKYYGFRDDWRVAL